MNKSKSTAKHLLLLVALLFNFSCAPTNRLGGDKESIVSSIKMYGFGLSATTKLEIDTAMILIAHKHSSDIRKAFLPQLQNALRRANRSEANGFVYSRTRVCYAIAYSNGKSERVFVDRGGVNILYRNRSYVIDERIADAITTYLPLDSMLVNDGSKKEAYRKEDYTPSILKAKK